MGAYFIISVSESANIAANTPKYSFATVIVKQMIRVFKAGVIDRVIF